MISIIYEIPILCMISVFLSTLLICMTGLLCLMNEGMIGLLGLMLPFFIINNYYYRLLIIDYIYVLIQRLFDNIISYLFVLDSAVLKGI